MRKRNPDVNPAAGRRGEKRANGEGAVRGACCTGREPTKLTLSGYGDIKFAAMSNSIWMAPAAAEA